MDTGPCLFVVSCAASYLVVWATGSRLVSGFGLLSVFSSEWIQVPIIFGSTSVRTQLLVSFSLSLFFLLLSFFSLLVVFAVPYRLLWVVDFLASSGHTLLGPLAIGF